MKEPLSSLPEQSKEAIHAAKNAAQAVEIARNDQAQQVAELAAIKAAELAAEKLFEDRRLTRIVHEAVMKGFSFEDSDERRRFIDVTKEKLICQSIVNISNRLDGIEGNLTWGVRIVLGAVILALLGMVLIK